MRISQSKLAHVFNQYKNPMTMFKTIFLVALTLLYLFLVFNLSKGVLPHFEKTPGQLAALGPSAQDDCLTAAAIERLRQSGGAGQYVALVPAGTGHQLMTSPDGISWSAAPRSPAIFGPLLPLSLAYWCHWQLLAMDFS